MVVETPPPPSNRAVATPMAGVVGIAGAAGTVGKRVGTVGAMGVVGVSAASRARVVVEIPPPPASNIDVVIPRSGAATAGVTNGVTAGTTGANKARAVIGNVTVIVGKAGMVGARSAVKIGVPPPGVGNNAKAFLTGL